MFHPLFIDLMKFWRKIVAEKIKMQKYYDSLTLIISQASRMGPLYLFDDKRARN